MHTVQVALADRSYPIYIGAGLLARSELLAQHLPQNRVALITDTTVGGLYLDTVAGALDAAGVRVTRVVVPAGEQHKDLLTLNTVFDALLADRCERKTTLVALGGGVIGDLAGFAAATYLRGVPFIQVPTTLLAQVDSSVGGKTAVNHPRGKNLIGAFYQPRAVIADTATLDTLPDRELAAGLAEVIKYGLIRDPVFFAWLERNIEALLGRDPQALAHAISRSCENKAEVVAADEREESGTRALLNLGHTFGHAIEAGLGYGTWLHGEAVAAGMICASRLAERRGLIAPAVTQRQKSLLARFGLPTASEPWPIDALLATMRNDKKTLAGRMRFILPRRLGDAALFDDVTEDDVRQVLNSVLSS